MLTNLLLLEVLAEVADNEEVAVRKALLGDLNIDGILGEDAVCPLDHLASILFRHVVAAGVDGGLEGAVLLGWSPPQLFGIVAKQPIPEEGIEVCVYLLPLLLVYTLVISDLHLVDAPNCKEEDEEASLGYCAVA